MDNATWTECLERTLMLVATGQAGQAGTVMVGAPDGRNCPAQLIGCSGFIKLEGARGYDRNIWPPEEAGAAVAAFAAYVKDFS